MKINEIFESVLSPEFKQWFGQSKVVDSDGNPKKVFRGVYGDNKNIAPAFYTDHAGEASAYTEYTDMVNAEKMQGKIEHADGKQLIGQRVPSIGIISDAKENGLIDQVIATDEGIVSISKNGVVRYYDNVVYDNNTFEYDSSGQDTIVIKGGKNNDYQRAMDDNDEFVNRQFSGGQDARVYPVYLKIENPANLSPLEANVVTQRFGEKTEKKGEKLIKRLKSEGYDGIITQSDEASQFPDVADSMGGIPDQYIPFDKSQVRSAFK